MHNTSLFDFPRINLQHLLKSDPDYKQPLYVLGVIPSRRSRIYVPVPHYDKVALIPIGHLCCI